MTAYRIQTDRLLIRCYSPEDAPKLKEAIDASLDHLRPWMPWAKDDPETLDAKVELLRRFRGNFDLGNDFIYGIFSPEDSVVLGGVGLHPRVGPNALEIGRKLGFTLEATLRRRAVRPDGSDRDTMIWRLFATDYIESAASRARVAAFDAGGRPLF